MDSKIKGEIGNHKIIADFLEKGYNVYIPVGDNSSVDLIIEKNNKILKIQCKYKNMNKKGVLRIKVHGSNQNGKKTRNYIKDKIDYIVIYCPELNKIYYVPFSFFKKYTDMFVLRVKKPKNKVNFIIYADEFKIWRG